MNYLWIGIIVLLILFRGPILSLIIKIMMTKHRWIFVILVVLPASTIFDLLWYIRNKYVFWTQKAAKTHKKRVEHVQNQVKRWIESNCDKPMCTSRSTLFTISLRKSKHKESMEKIDLSGLNNILEIDEKRQVVRVEPYVTCGQLTATLDPLGYTVPVVPELDDLTIGGLVSGFGVESSSHKAGLFQAVCESFEIVTATGELLKCSPTENEELFYAIPWSYGALGFLVCIELKIIPAKKFVHLKYYPCYSTDEYCALLEKVSGDNNIMFVEALAFSKDEAVVMTGNLTDYPVKSKINSIGYFWKPWFYEHVRGFLKSGKGEDYIPLRHYYHRHSKAVFWEMEQIIPFGNHPLFRYTLGWMIPPKISFLKITTPPELYKEYEENHIIQDLLVPLSTLQKSIEKMHNEWQVYPLWICPMKLFHTKYRGFVNPTGNKDEMFVDIGAYGIPKAKLFKEHGHIESHRRMEQFVRDVKGFHALYADIFMTEEEFREMFDHELIDKLRKKYNCEKAFPSAYEKVSRKARNGL